MVQTSQSASPARVSERERPIPESMLPSEDAVQLIDSIIMRTANEILQALDLLDDFDHPIERAIGTTSLLEALAGIVGEVKEVRRAAIKDAYEMGRSEPGGGWYGYSAIAQQIGVSPSRVRQILLDINIKNDGKTEIRDDEVEAIREMANARRDAIKMIKANKSVEEIVASTKLPTDEVERIAKTINSRA